MISPSHSAPENATTQRGRILGLLIDARGEWVPLPEILACAAQYNARVWELRRAGYVIENRVERGADGICRSWFRLASEPESATRLEPPPAQTQPPRHGITQLAPPSTSSADLPPAQGEDWYTAQTGKPRPTSILRDSGPLFTVERR